MPGSWIWTDGQPLGTIDHVGYKVAIEIRRYTFNTKEPQHGHPAYVEHGGWSSTTRHAVEDGQVPQDGKLRAVCGELFDSVSSEEFTVNTPDPCGGCLMHVAVLDPNTGKLRAPDFGEWAPPAVELGQYLSDLGYMVQQQRVSSSRHELVAVRGTVRFEVDWSHGWDGWEPGVRPLVRMYDPLHNDVGITKEEFAEWNNERIATLPRCYLRTHNDVQRLARLDEAAIVAWVRRKWRPQSYVKANRQHRVFRWSLWQIWGRLPGCSKVTIWEDQ